MGIAGIIAITIFIFLGGKVVQLLWNWLMPMLFGLREVTFWQARRHSRAEPHSVRRLRDGRRRLAPAAGVADMSPEERERFRQRMRDRCGMGENAEAPPPRQRAPGLPRRSAKREGGNQP